MDALEHLLPRFGITKSSNEQGSPQWTISIVSDEANSRPLTAYFDEELRNWRLDAGVNDQPPEAPLVPITLNTVLQQPRSISHSKSAAWINDLYVSDHTDLFRNLNWAATPLGPCRTWPKSLCLYTHMLFSDSRAAAIYWGPEHISIYNENLPPLIGDLHPVLMGRPFEQVMPGLWEFFGPLFTAIEKDQHGFAWNGLELPSMRNGYLEETHWDGGLMSLQDDRGDYGGVYLSCTEVTRMALRDRNTALVNRLRRSSLVSTNMVWQHIHEVFADYPRDVPMAITYGADEGCPDDNRLLLKHTLGLSSAKSIAPSNIDVSGCFCSSGLF